MNPKAQKLPSIRMLLLIAVSSLLLGACSTTTTISYSYTDGNGEKVAESYKVYDGDSDFRSLEIPAGTTVTIDSWTEVSEVVYGNTTTTTYKDPIARSVVACLTAYLSAQDANMSAETLANGLNQLYNDHDNPVTKSCEQKASDTVTPLTVACPSKTVCEQAVLKPKGNDLPVCGCLVAKAPPACDSAEFAAVDANGKPLWTTCKPAETGGEMYSEAAKKKAALELMTKEQIEEQLKQAPNDPLLKSMMSGCTLVYSMVTHSYVCQ